VAGTFRRDEGESISIILVLFPDIYLCDQMVQAQQARDQQILDLVTAMEDTYSFVVSADELKQNDKLQDIINQILKQTIECGYFIQKYTRHSFGGSWQAYWTR
jgi:ABC-type amino acid transport substrate-binding protein